MMFARFFGKRFMLFLIGVVAAMPGFAQTAAFTYQGE